jgi:hypothetical protein
MAGQRQNDQEASQPGAGSHQGRERPRTPLDLTDPAHQRTLIDAAVATLPPSRPSPDGRSMPAAPSARTPSTRR